MQNKMKVGDFCYENAPIRPTEGTSRSSKLKSAMGKLSKKQTI
jgi:hypothetical protein